MATGKATVKDVAKMAGTSVATVSRVFSNSGYPVSAQLRQRVTQAAKALAYAPSPAAQSRKQATGLGAKCIALVVPVLSNPYYTLTLQGVSTVCREKDYQLILCDSNMSVQEEGRILNSLAARKVQGVIISPMAESGNTYRQYTDGGMIFVKLDQQEENDDCYSIHFDTQMGAELAMRHFEAKGHRRIAFAATPLNRRTRQLTYRGYQKHMQRTGMANDSLLFIMDAASQAEHGSNEVLAGQMAARRFVASGCTATAVLCVNDMVAFGLVNELHRLGVRVPRDVSVVGLDDIPFAELYIPALTTIHCASNEVGRFAAMVLIDRIETGAESRSLNMRLEPTLVERDSVRDINVQESLENY